jgi:hypothetical protein
VVTDKQIRAGSFGCLKEFHRRVDAAAHAFDLATILDLQAVVGAVLIIGYRQLFIQKISDLF